MRGPKGTPDQVSGALPLFLSSSLPLFLSSSLPLFLSSSLPLFLSSSLPLFLSSSLPLFLSSSLPLFLSSSLPLLVCRQRLHRPGVHGNLHFVAIGGRHERHAHARECIHEGQIAGAPQ